MILLSWLSPVSLLAVGPDSPGWIDDYRQWQNEVIEKIREPWFFFGMGAQFLFFLRFFWQWVVSERRHRSTIPIAFWYFSLAGGISVFVYACHERQPVFMLGQLLACFIYIRNLVLIYKRAAERKRIGLPRRKLRSVTGNDETNG